MLSGAPVAWPLAVQAQKPAMPVVGFVRSTSASTSAPDIVPAFLSGLGELGYVEGRNFQIEYRWADGHVRLAAWPAWPIWLTVTSP